MRRAAKVDANHGQIIATIRGFGISVSDTSNVGEGFPDTVCGYGIGADGTGGRCFLVEIKDGAKVPSKRRLTPAQEAFRASWKGNYVVLETVEQARMWCIAVTKNLA